MGAAFVALICALMSATGIGPAVAGPAGFASLEIPTGARAAALGGAYATLVQGVEAAFWNPAGLESVHGIQVTGGHDELFEALRHDHFAVAGRLLGGGASASVRALYSEPIEERDELGNLIGTFGSHELELAMGYGRSVAPGMSMGGTAQLIRERIANSAVTTYGVGLGASWQPVESSTLRLSLAAQNLGPAAHYMIDGERGDPVPLPAAVQGGMSYGLPLGSLDLRGAVEGRLTRGRTALGLMGAELSSPVGAALRAGLRLNDSVSSVSVGVGYAMKALRLDYAFVPLRLDLGDTHRFSFAAQF